MKKLSKWSETILYSNSFFFSEAVSKFYPLISLPFKNVGKQKTREINTHSAEKAKLKFILKISSVKVTKSAGKSGFGHIN